MWLIMCFTNVMFFLFFRILSEKTTEPIIAKLEHIRCMPSVLRKICQAFSVSCFTLRLWGQIVLQCYDTVGWVM